MLPIEFNLSACSSTLPTEVPAKHLLPHATYIGYQPSTNISNRVRKLIELQVTVGGNGQWHAEGKKNFRQIGQEKFSSILLSGCAYLSN
jgi:hypothetical protein